MSRTHRSAWAFGAALLFSVVNFAMTLFATPWLLQWLGAERFGAFRVLFDLVAYVILLEFGLSTALPSNYAAALARRDEERVAAVISAGTRAYLRVLAPMALLGALAVPFIPDIVAAGIPETEIRTAWVLMLAIALLRPVQVFSRLLEAQQRAHVVSILLIAQAVAMTGMMLVFAWAGWGLVGQAVAAVAAHVISVFAIGWAALRRFPGALRHPPPPDVSRGIWSLNWAAFVTGTSTRVALLSDNIIVSWVLGAAWVTPFFLTQRLIHIAVTQLNAIANVTWPALAELYGRGEMELFRTRALELTRLVSGLGLGGLAAIVAYNRHFVSLWVGPETYAGEWVTWLTALSVWMWALSTLWNWLLDGTGEIRRWVPYSVAFMVTNAIVSVAATFALGLVGPLVGSVSAFLLVSSWAFPRVLRNIFGFRPGDLLGAAAKPLLWAGPYAALLWWIASTHQPYGWPGLLAELAAAGAGGVALWWRIDLDADQRRIWQERGRSLLGGRRGGGPPSGDPEPRSTATV